MIDTELSALLGTTLDPSKQNQLVRCPMHDDRVASLSISLSKGAWYCFGCGKGGGLLTLARFLGGDLDTTDLLVQTLNLAPEPEQVDFREKYETFLPVKITTPEALTYSQQRGISFETLQAFGVRYDTRGTLVMPYLDGERVAALRYRGRTDKWYEPGSERTLYGLNALRGASTVVLAEGESDTHSLHSYVQSAGLGESIAVGGVPGANSSVAQWELWTLDLMWADKIYVAFDADDAGDKGAERAIRTLGSVANRLRPTTATDWADALRNKETPEF